MKAVVIYSGGMDSGTLLREVAAEGKLELAALSFDYEQRHKKELIYARGNCNELGIPHTIVDLSDVNVLLQGSALTSPDMPVPHGHYADENMKQTVVPNRNMILLSLAIGYAVSIDAEAVYYGAHSGDHEIYPDCRPEFVELMKRLAMISNFKEIDLRAPYLYGDKSTILEVGQRLDIDYGKMWTCYEGGDEPCGKCGACVERAEAFAKMGMRDPAVDRPGDYYAWYRDVLAGPPDG